MCSGIRDAQSLAWRLDLVLSRNAHKVILDDYQTERSEHVGHPFRARCFSATSSKPVVDGSRGFATGCCSNGGGGYFTVKEGRIGPTTGVHPNPDFAQIWRNADVAVRALMNSDETELLRHRYSRRRRFGLVGQIDPTL